MTWNPDIKLVPEDDKKIPSFFLMLAYDYAAKHSDDPYTKIGAVIVEPDLHQVVAYGTNHFPDGLGPTSEQIADRDWKLKHTIHAEPAAIIDAAMSGSGLSTIGATMYIPWVPCTPCALAIADAGIERLVGHKSLIMKTPERWRKSCDDAISLLKKCGVECLMYDGKIGGIEHLFNGEVWEP